MRGGVVAYAPAFADAGGGRGGGAWVHGAMPYVSAFANAGDGRGAGLGAWGCALRFCIFNTCMQITL
ncbi:MAG: hypothetical protein RSC68_34725 [Acinetobacter sp.]